MEVFKWNKRKDQTDPGFMVRITDEEALQIIQSLSAQLCSKNPNSGRTEFFTVKGEYFSIAVSDPNKVTQDEMEIDYVYNRIKNEANWDRNFKAPWRNR